MQITSKKLWPALCIMCVSVFATASADTYSNNNQPSQMSQSSEMGTYERGSQRDITPAAGPRVSHGADVFITADFIWWKATQEGTRYASTGIAPGESPNSTVQNVPKGNTRSVGRDWSPGFKVGLGLNLDHDGWDLFAEYTWLSPSNSSSVTNTLEPDTNYGVISLQTPNTDEGPYGNDVDRDNYRWDQASANWSLNFNVIDLELGRNLHLSRFLTLRPFFGLKATWQDQDMNTTLSKASGVDIGFSPNNPAGPYRIKQSSDVWGIGVRGGFNAAWYMSKNWSFYGDLAITTMWTDHTDLTRKDTVSDPTDAVGSTAVMVNIKEDDFYSVKYIGELELGLRYEMWFYDDNYHFAIQAGWEQQVWVNWNTFHSLTQPDNWSDLNFQGLNLKFRFDF